MLPLIESSLQMDSHTDLPSYDTARQRDIWPFVLPYLSILDLLSLARTSQTLSGRVQGFLWFAPRRFWPSDHEDAFVMFKEFLLVLRSLDPSLRWHPGHYTRVLDISNFRREAFSMPLPRDWLSLVLSRLPNLTCLIVSHSAIFGSDTIHELPQHGSLRLLDASNCPNLTGDALSRLLQSVPSIVYLDISGNKSLGIDRGALWAQLRALSLRVLRLQRLGITRQLEQAIRTRNIVRPPYHCLDVRGNPVDDTLVELLLDLHLGLTSHPPPPYTHQEPVHLGVGNRLDFGNDAEDIPLFIESKIRSRDGKATLNHDLVSMVSIFRNVNLEIPWMSTADHQYLTEIDLSGTEVTFRACAKLLTALPLQTFSCGRSPMAARGSNRYRNGVDPIRFIQDIYDSKRLVVALRHCPTLRVLRCPHFVVTGFSSAWDSISWLGRVEKPEQDTGEEESFITASAPLQGRQWLPNLTRISNKWDFCFDASLVSLERLILTDVPNYSGHGHVISCFKAFLQAAGDWSRVQRQYQRMRVDAEQKSGGGAGSISHAHSKSGMMAGSRVHRREPHVVDVALQSLALEMGSDRRGNTNQATYETSLSPEGESENAFDQLLRDDFSFFAEERATAGFDQAQTFSRPDLDVIASLGEFRRNSKAIPERPDGADGVWRGALTVQRYPSR